MKKVLNILFWCLLCGVFIASLAFGERADNVLSIKSIYVDIDHEHGNYFIQQSDIIEQLAGIGIRNMDYEKGDIDFHAVERKLQNNPSIKTAEIFYALNGELTVRIKQRMPILRVYNQRNESFYLDVEGGIMPISNSYTSRVPVASGAIQISFGEMAALDQNQLQQALKYWPNKPERTFYKQNQNKLINLDSLVAVKQWKELWDIAIFLKENPFWNAQISQINLSKNGDYHLIPNVGNHDIILGSAAHLEQKFNKLMVFYQKGLSNTGWNEYSKINLKFNKQVICTKKYI